MSSGKRKLWQWIAAIVIALLVILAGISLYFNAKWKPLLTEKIKEVVYKGSKHLYTISFKDIRLNLINGTVTVDSILLAPDTAVFNARRKAGTAPTHLFRVKLARLRLRHVSILTVYFQRKIEMNDIILESPSVNMIYNKVSEKPDTAKDQRSLYQRIAKTLKSVHIKGISIEDADFNYVSGATGMILNTVQHLNLQVKDFLLDAHSGDDTTRFYYTKDVSFDLAGYHSLSKNKLYTTKIDSLTGSARGRSIHLKGLKLIPMYPELQFSRMLKTQKDRYDLNFSRVDFSGVNFMKLNAEGVLHAGAIKIKQSEIKIFMNREMPHGHGDASGSFPPALLKKLPIETTIDTLEFNRVNVAYTEYNPASLDKGTVHIDQITGSVLNVTNDSLSLVKNHHAQAKISALLIKTAPLEIRIDFDLLSTVSAFTFKGDIGRFDMVKLNPLSVSLGLVKIQSGQVQKMHFEASANTNGSSGVLWMYYNDLKIALMKKGEDGKPAQKKGLLSFLANTLVIKDANPTRGKPLRAGKISFQRPPGASFFNVLWSSVFMGMKETVGLDILSKKSPEEKGKAAEKKIKERKGKSEFRKQKRQEKRAERKAKRAN